MYAQLLKPVVLQTWSEKFLSRMADNSLLTASRAQYDYLVASGMSSKATSRVQSRMCSPRDWHCQSGFSNSLDPGVSQVICFHQIIGFVI